MDEKHEIALWSAIAAGCASLLATGILDLINSKEVWEFVGAFVVALITGLAVYSKQRIDDAKALKKRSDGKKEDD